MEKRLDDLKASDAQKQAQGLAQKAEQIGDLKLLVCEIDSVGAKDLRNMADQLRQDLGSGIVCLGSHQAGKATLLIAVTQDLTNRFKAGALIKELSPLIGGKGGGKPDLAQAGGSNPAGLADVFAALRTKCAQG